METSLFGGVVVKGLVKKESLEITFQNGLYISQNALKTVY
jgi:hypothetical protein